MDAYTHVLRLSWANRYLAKKDVKNCVQVWIKNVKIQNATWKPD